MKRSILFVANQKDREMISALEGVSTWQVVAAFSLTELADITADWPDFDLILLNIELIWQPVSLVMARFRAAELQVSLALYTTDEDLPTPIERIQLHAADLVHLHGISIEDTAAAIETLYQQHLSQMESRPEQSQYSPILDAVAFTSAQLVVKDELVSILERIFPYLGQISKADTIYFFQQDQGEAAGPKQINMMYQWHKNRETPIVEARPAHWQNFEYEGFSLESVMDALNRGEVIYGSLDAFEQPVQQFLTDIVNTNFIAVAPIFCFGEWWGGLVIEVWSDAYSWVAADAQAFQTVANMLGSVIQNTTVLEEQSSQLVQAQTISSVLRRQTDELASLYEISTSITGVLEPHELIERLYDQIVNLMGPDMVIGVLYDDQTEEIEVVVARELGTPLKTLPVGTRLHVKEAGLTGWMIQNAKTVFLKDYLEQKGPAPIRRVGGEPRSWLGTPLMVQGRVIGAISVQAYQPNVFDRADIRFVEAVATQAAVGINSARIYQKELQRRQVSEKLHLLTAQLNKTLEIEPIMTQAIETIRAILPDMSICVISFYDVEQDTLTTQAIWSDQERYIFTAVGQSIALSETQMAQQAIMSQEMIIVEDMDKVAPKNERSARIQQTGIGALLYIPMILNGQPIGLLSTNFWDRARPFAADEIALCEAATNHVVMAIKNARVYESEIKRRREAELLQKLSSYLIETTDIEQIFAMAVSLLHEYLPDVSSLRFMLLDATNRYLKPTKGWRDERLPPPSFTEHDQAPIESTIYARMCFEEKRLVLVDKVMLTRAAKGLLRQRLELGLRGLFYVPLLLKEEAVGMLQIELWNTHRHFNDEEIALCQAVCNQVATVIEKVKLIEAEREQLQLAQTLSDMGALLTSDLTLGEVFERIFDLLAEVLPYDTVSIQLYDANYDQMSLAAGRGFRDIERAAEVVKQIGYQELVLLEASPFRITEDVEQDEDWIHIEDYDPIRSSISCALRVKGRLVGILSVDSFTPFAYDRTIAEKATAFANQAIIAIENARLYDQLHQRAEELSVLNLIAIAAAIVNNIDELFTATTELIVERIFTEHFGFLLLDDTRLYLVPHASYYIKDRPKLPYRLAVSHTLTGHVVQTQRPYWGNIDSDTIPRYYRFDESSGSELAVPLIVNNEVFGVINVEKAEQNAFTERDLDFVQGLADQLSVAIQRVQLYEDSQFYAAQLEDKVEQRTAELKNQYERMQMILDNVGEGVIFADEETNVIYANPALLAQSGYSKEDLIGRPARVLNSPLHNTADTFVEMRRFLSEHQSWTGELVNMRKDGSFYEILLNINAIRDMNNRLIGFVSIQADITHLKEIERLKSEFVSNVSHELRTPLTNIKTYLTLLRRGREEKRERYLQVLEHEADRLARLIQDLLDLSRLDSNSVKTKLEPLDLAALIYKGVESFHAKTEGKQQQIRVVDSPNLPQVLADNDQLMQVFHNLVGNATDYTPEGGTITIQMDTVIKEDQLMVGFCVQDTGLGIAPQELSQLFDRFFRGEAARTSQAPGTGLGLAISKEIIERHNGLIEVESQPEVGTTFKVWLPVVDPDSLSS